MGSMAVQLDVRTDELVGALLEIIRPYIGNFR